MTRLSTSFAETHKYSVVER